MTEAKLHRFDLACDDCGRVEKPLFLFREQGMQNELLCRSCYAKKVLSKSAPATNTSALQEGSC